MVEMINQVRALNNQKLECLKEIYQITLKQKESLASEDIEGLENLINSKQKVIDKVKKIDAQMADITNAEHEVVEEIKNIAKQAYEIDQDNRISASNFLEKFRINIGKVRNAQKVNKAYNPTYAGSAFINKSR